MDLVLLPIYNYKLTNWVLVLDENKVMFEKLSNNLNILMAEARINASELARRVNLPASTIKKIRNNDNPNPTLTTLLPLAQYFSLTVSQLVGDEPLPESRIWGIYQQSNNIFQSIPLLTWQEAIDWPATKNEPHSILKTEYQYSENAYALLVEENNWENLVKGTALLVDPNLSPEHRDFIISYKKGQKVPTLKQLLLDEGELYLKPVVQGYNTTIFTSDYTILAVVVEYKLHLKKEIDLLPN